MRSMTTAGRGRVALAWVLALAGCGEEARDEPASATSAAPEREDQGLGYLDELAHLGYVDDTGEADGEPSGVVLHDREAAWPGVNLYLSLPDSAAFLIDMEGRELHRWHDATGTNVRWSRVELLPDGDALAIAPKENQLIRQRWDGTERWRRSLDAHHDLRATSAGEILVLTRTLRQLPAVHPTRGVVDNGVARLDGGGNVLAEHSLYELLSSDARIPIEPPPNIDETPPQFNVDPIHANTLEPIAFEHLAERHAMYAPGNLLLTLRYTCAVVIANLERGEVLWFWGPGEVEGPHDATLLENGNVLLLDNGWVERGYSRVLEVDPLEGRVVWEYRAPEPSDFFTAGRGTVQPLPNGNVLVGNSNSGEAFEVTRAGEVVWRFLNPNVTAEGARGVLRIRRYSVKAIEAMRVRASGG